MISQPCDEYDEGGSKRYRKYKQFGQHRYSENVQSPLGNSRLERLRVIVEGLEKLRLVAVELVAVEQRHRDSAEFRRNKYRKALM